MNKLFLMYTMIISFSVFGQQTTESKKYALEVAGIKVGEMQAIKQTLGKGLVNYYVKSDVRVNLLVYILKIKYEVTSQFDQNGLVYSIAKVNSNKGDFLTTTYYKNGRYEVKSKQEKKEFENNINSDIIWSSSRLFFEEPGHNQEFFAEYYAVFNKLKKNKDGTFTCQIEKNIDNYVYNHQKLVRVIKKNPIKNIELRFISEKVTTDPEI